MCEEEVCGRLVVFFCREVRGWGFGRFSSIALCGLRFSFFGFGCTDIRVSLFCV